MREGEGRLGLADPAEAGDRLRHDQRLAVR